MPSKAASSDKLAGQLMLVCAIAFSIAFVTILLAHIFERFGYAPCPLCLQERYAYYFGVPATVVAFFAARAESFSLTRVLLVLVGLAFLDQCRRRRLSRRRRMEVVGWPDIVLRRDGGGMGPRRRCRRHRASASGELQRGVVAHARPVLRRLERGGLRLARRHRRLRRDDAAVKPLSPQGRGEVAPLLGKTVAYGSSSVSQ